MMIPSLQSTPPDYSGIFLALAGSITVVITGMMALVSMMSKSHFSDYKELKEENRRQSETVTKCRVAVNQLRDELGDQKREYQRELSDLREQIQVLTKQKTQVEDALLKASQQNKECADTLEQVRKERDKLKVERDTLRQENQTLAERLHANAQIMAELQAQVSALTERASELESKASGQADTIASLQRQLTAFGHQKIEPPENSEADTP